MQVCKYASIHIYANKCEAIYMSAVAAFFLHNITLEDPLSHFLKKLLRHIKLFFCPINSGFKHFQKHRVTEYNWRILQHYQTKKLNSFEANQIVWK